MIDRTQSVRNRVRATAVDPGLPLGLHEPKLDGDVGWDLAAAMDVVIGPMQCADVPVNLRLALPAGVYADVRNRSSMARRGLYVDQNVVDSGYRGPMFVFVRNMGLPQMRAMTDLEIQHAQNATALVVAGQPVAPYRGPNVAALLPEADPGTIVIKAGERIAQLVFHRADPIWVGHVVEFEDETERGARGFGSTGA